MHVIFIALFAAVALYYAFIMYRDYTTFEYDPSDPAYDTWYERLWAVGRGSAVKVWARMVGVVTAVIGIIVGVLPYMMSPEITEVIKSYLDPQYVTIGIIAIMAISEYARNRTMTE